MTSHKFPTTLTDLQSELLEHAKDGRSDAVFRFLIAMDQIGSLVRHHTHDQIENPASRPHGTPASQIDAAGNAIVQLLTYCALRDIDLQEAVNVALGNLREQDFKKRVAEGEEIKGVVACTVTPSGSSTLTGVAIVQSGWVPKFKGRILVASHPEADVRLKTFTAIVTDQGGYGCHAGIIARESGIPCIVGTGNATQKIKTGDLIRLDLTSGIVEIVNE